jgi:hypothetical protein
LLGTTAIGAATPAAAGMERYGYYYNDRDRWDRGRDRDWRWRDRDRWAYDRDWRHRHRHRHDDDAAAAIFGAIAGTAAAIIGSAVTDSSYERCSEAYRSFEPETWTYLGYDGYRHTCPY